MALMDFLKKQFVDVIEWNETENNTLAWRYPIADQEIQNGAKLTVRESQLALFVNEGKIADLFQPGLHTLTTQTLPILTNLKNWDKFFASPFKSDVYFFSTREQIDQRWGTQNPIVIRDKEFGPIRVRAHGTYSYRLQDPKIFFQKISGTREKYSAPEIENQLRAIILTQIATLFGSSQVDFMDMAAHQNKFSETLEAALLVPFAEYGLKLESYFVQSISLPEEVQAYLDKSTSMKIVGDMKRYAQFQTAESIPLAAENPGGLAGVGAGLGAGVSIGQTMASAFAPSSQTSGEAEDLVEMIGKLHELLTKGVLTQAEFDAKKTELLKKIS